MFIAYVKQAGYGCDYTIDCGNTLWKLNADSKEEAVEELKKKIIGELDTQHGAYYEGFWDELKLMSVELFEVADYEDLDVGLWYKEAEAKAKSIKDSLRKSKEKAEYERLKAKFEKEN